MARPQVLLILSGSGCTCSPFGKNNMKITQTYKTDSNAHTACHTLAKAVKEAYPQSKLSCTQHDPNDILCVYEGNVSIEGVSYGILSSAITNRELEISIESAEHNHEAVFEAIVEAHQSRQDAGGNTHTIKRLV